jgi:hypothetical protein
VYNNEDLILVVDVGSCGSGRNIPLRLGIFVKENLEDLLTNPRSMDTILCVSKILRQSPLTYPEIEAQSRDD